MASRVLPHAAGADAPDLLAEVLAERAAMSDLERLLLRFGALDPR